MKTIACAGIMMLAPLLGFAAPATAQVETGLGQRFQFDMKGQVPSGFTDGYIRLFVDVENAQNAQVECKLSNRKWKVSGFRDLASTFLNGISREQQTWGIAMNVESPGGSGGGSLSTDLDVLTYALNTKDRTCVQSSSNSDFRSPLFSLRAPDRKLNIQFKIYFTQKPAEETRSEFRDGATAIANFVGVPVGLAGSMLQGFGDSALDGLTENISNSHLEPFNVPSDRSKVMRVSLSPQPNGQPYPGEPVATVRFEPVRSIFSEPNDSAQYTDYPSWINRMGPEEVVRYKLANQTVNSVVREKLGDIRYEALIKANTTELIDKSCADIVEVLGDTDLSYLDQTLIAWAYAARTASSRWKESGHAYASAPCVLQRAETLKLSGIEIPLPPPLPEPPVEQKPVQMAATKAQMERALRFARLSMMAASAEDRRDLLPEAFSTELKVIDLTGQDLFSLNDNAVVSGHDAIGALVSERIERLGCHIFYSGEGEARRTDLFSVGFSQAEPVRMVESLVQLKGHPDATFWARWEFDPSASATEPGQITGVALQRMRDAVAARFKGQFEVSGCGQGDWWPAGVLQAPPN